MDKLIPVALYGRYSPGSKQRQKDVSIEQQFDDCKRYCEHNGYKVVAEYADRAQTGTNDKRKAFQRMIHDSSKGNFQFVICWKVDRFGRDRYDIAHYKFKLKKNNVKVLYAKENIPEGPEGILLESILEGSAEYYSANLSQNILRGMKANAQECKVNGLPPYGYRKGEDGKFEIDPDQAEVVEYIFSNYLNGVRSQDIVADLNAMMKKTSRGTPFKTTSLQHILRNERYTGVYIHGEARIEGGMPVIIEKERFEKVQGLKIQKQHNSAAGRKNRFILTGKLFCGSCGYPMRGDGGTGKSGKQYQYYSCVGKIKGDCQKKSVPQLELEVDIARLIIDELLIDENINSIVNAAIKLQEDENSDALLKSYKKQLATVNKKIKGIMNAIYEGITTSTTKEDLLSCEEEKLDLEFLIEEESKPKPMITKEQLTFWMERFKGGDYHDEKFRESLFDIFIYQIYCYDTEYRVVANFKEGFKEFTKKQIDNIESEKGFIFERGWVPTNHLEQRCSPELQGCNVFNCDAVGGDDGN